MLSVEDYAIIPLTIASGATVTNAIDVRGYKTFILEMNTTAWDAAAITYESAISFGGNYTPVITTAGTEASVSSTVATINKTIILDNIEGLHFIKLRSGIEVTPVVQTGDRNLNLLVKS